MSVNLNHVRMMQSADLKVSTMNATASQGLVVNSARFRLMSVPVVPVEIMAAVWME